MDQMTHKIEDIRLLDNNYDSKLVEFQRQSKHIDQVNEKIHDIRQPPRIQRQSLIHLPSTSS